MALLTEEKRAAYFKYLGLGEYNEINIRKVQSKYLRKKDVDGKYGTDTDRLIRHLRNVKKYTTDFSPQEFRCECGGKYCTGYPSYMKASELKNLQSIRSHYNKTMKITCGLRCKTYNDKLRGSVKNSKHLTGYASDFYISGVTDSLAARKKAIKWIKKLPNHNYTYGDGINSNGLKIAASYMGNALHTETKKKTTKKTTTTKVSTAAKTTTTKTTTTTTKKKKFKKITLVTRAELLAAIKKQHEWSKNAVYVWVEGPNVKNSKKKNTCISLPNVSYQRVKYLPSSGYVYFHPTKKKIWGNRRSYVKKHTEAFKISYPNKTVKWLYKHGKIKPGDFVGYGNPGYHSMCFLGMSKKGYPLFATAGHKRGYNVRYKSYENRKVNMLINVKCSDDK